MRGLRRPPGLVLAGLVGLVVLLSPVLALLLRAPWHDLTGALDRTQSWPALRLSLRTATLSMLVSLVLGVPLAWLLARGRLPFTGLLRALVTVPLVLPPVVGGIALLLAFGRRGVLGRPLGLQIPFTTTGVVLAETFVAMPFLVVTAEAAFRAMDDRREQVAATLGAGPWRQLVLVTLPGARAGIAAGAALCWARALGEFGATITFAGSLAGTTRTGPLQVAFLLPADPDAATAVSVVLLGICVLVLTLLRGAWVPALVARLPGRARTT